MECFLQTLQRQLKTVVADEMTNLAMEVFEYGGGRCKLFGGVLFAARYQVAELQHKTAVGLVQVVSRTAELFGTGCGTLALHAEVAVGNNTETEMRAFSHFLPQSPNSER